MYCTVRCGSGILDASSPRLLPSGTLGFTESKNPAQKAMESCGASSAGNGAAAELRSASISIGARKAPAAPHENSLPNKSRRSNAINLTPQRFVAEYAIPRNACQLYGLARSSMLVGV